MRKRRWMETWRHACLACCGWLTLGTTPRGEPSLLCAWCADTLSKHAVGLLELVGMCRLITQSVVESQPHSPVFVFRQLWRALAAAAGPGAPVLLPKLPQGLRGGAGGCAAILSSAAEVRLLLCYCCTLVLLCGRVLPNLRIAMTRKAAGIPHAQPAASWPCAPTGYRSCTAGRHASAPRPTLASTRLFSAPAPPVTAGHAQQQGVLETQ